MNILNFKICERTMSKDFFYFAVEMLLSNKQEILLARNQLLHLLSNH